MLVSLPGKVSTFILARNSLRLNQQVVLLLCTRNREVKIVKRKSKYKRGQMLAKTECNCASVYQVQDPFPQKTEMHVNLSGVGLLRASTTLWRQVALLCF